MNQRQVTFHGVGLNLTLPQQRCILALGRKGTAGLSRLGVPVLQDASTDPGVWLRLVVRGFVQADGSGCGLELSATGRAAFEELVDAEADAA